MNNIMTNFVSRVIKIDAITLDNELFSLIKRQVYNIIDSLKLTPWIEGYRPEVDLILKFIVWKFSIHDRQCSVGQKLLGIKFPNFPTRIKYLFLIDGLIPYIHQRLPYVFATWPATRVIERPLRYVENGMKICQLINFCAFLIENRYPTLSLRLAGLPLVPAYQRVHPSVGYSYQIRELLWHQFADFLMIILPLINIHRLKNYVSDLGGRKKMSKALTALAQMEDSVLKCCLCQEDATLPQRHNSCVYCYYCIRANLTADPNFQCTTCNHSSNT